MPQMSHEGITAALRLRAELERTKAASHPGDPIGAGVLEFYASVYARIADWIDAGCPDEETPS